MTCSRLFILGALLTIAPAVTAQPAPKAPAAKTAKAAKAPKAAAAPKAAPAAPAAPGYPPGLSELKVRTVRNQVELAGVERKAAHKDDLVLPGQKVATQAQSSAEVDYADGTRLVLSENSELSVYGVAPPPPPPGKKVKKAPVFKPGTTTLLRGEVLLIVPAPAAAPAPPPPPVAVAAKGKKAAKAPKKAAAKPAITATVATPVGKVVATPGTELRISVEQNGMTRVSVYSGQAELQGKGKPLVLAAGVGSRIETAKASPKPPAPLPEAPVTAGVQQLIFSSGQSVAVKGTYSPPTGTPPPAGWHVTVAHDAAFDDVISDLRIVATETRLITQRLEPGEYYARVSAVGLDGAEGKSSPPVRIRVAKVNVIPGGEGKRAAVAVEAKDIYCSLDGAPLAPMVDPLPLSPAKDHLLRCATVPDNPKKLELAEQKIPASQSGPMVARVEPGAVTFTPADPKTQVAASAQRQVTLVLSDAAGTPLTGATVRAEGVGGVQVGAVRESATPGSYVATATWSPGQTGHSIRYTVNEVETYEGRLPDALPPQPTEPKEVADSGEGKPFKRAAFELGLFPTAGVDVNRLVFDVGGGIDIGARIRLPYGAFAFALRPQYEFYPASPAVAHAIVAGLPITYRIRKNVDASDIVPYIGVLPQFIADYSYLAKDGRQVGDGKWNTSFGIGGLIGNEFRVRHGAVFVEAGYRYVMLRTVTDPIPSLSGIFANLGFRATF